MPVAKKSATKKVAASKVAKKKVKPASKSAPVAKKVAKKANVKPASKTAVKKKVAPKASASTAVKDNSSTGNDEYGMRKGTDLSIAAAEIVKGGKSRVDVIERLTGMLDNNTRTGKPKAVASVLAQAAKRLENAGYVEESSWRMVPGPDKSTDVDSKPRKAVKAKPVKKVLKRKGKAA